MRLSDGGGMGRRVEGICRSQRLPDIVIHSRRQSRSRYMLGFKLRWDPPTRPDTTNITSGRNRRG